SDQARYGEALLGCPDGVSAAAQVARTRGDLARAERLLRLAAAQRPAQPGRLEQLAEVQSARKELAGAVASIRGASALAPRSAEPLRRLANALELLGDAKAAAEARNAALRLAPGDLQVRQQIALDEGRRLLSWSNRDGAALVKASKEAPPGASAVRLLDFGAVQIDYLRGIAPRGPEMPGYSLGAFFFRDDETPMGESTYEARTPAPPEVDAHNLQLPQDALTRDADGFRFRYSARDVKPLQPEPHQVPESEVMPWVQLGTGSGQRELMRSLADWALLRTRPGSATAELAKRSTGAGVEDTARKIYASVAQAVRGRSTGSEFQTSAAHILAQGRGNRLVVLKAALAAARIPSHIVFARTF